MELPNRTQSPLSVSSQSYLEYPDPDQMKMLSDPKMPIGEVLEKLKVDQDKGLSRLEAEKRLTVFGVNELEKKGRMPLILLFLSQFLNLIILILVIAAIVSIIVGEIVEGIAVIVIILVTVSLSTFTEHSSGNALEALAQLTDPHTHVYRDGTLQVIRTPELVPGDIVELSPGDLVPADIRLIAGHSVKVNEMILTGESADVPKKENANASETASKLTNMNMVYSSTSVVEGRLKGIVLLTGMATRVGSIAALLAAADKQNEDERQHAHHHRTPEEEKGRVLRQMSISHEYEAPVIDSDDEYADDDDDDISREDEPLSKGSLTKGKENVFSQFFNQIRQKIKSFSPKQTPLQEGLHKLGMMMTAFALTGAVLVVIIGIFRGFRDPNNDENAAWLQSVLLAISMAVSAIPEGLPLVVTICLALGTTAMSKKNALIRRLPAVETLGSASVICSDKTGTLTSGKMTATRVWTYGQMYHVSGEGYDPTHGGITDCNSQKRSIDNSDAFVALTSTMYVANLCNEATVALTDKRWKPLGTSTEAALVVGTEKFGLDTIDNRRQHKRVLNIPFSSTFKMMATVHESNPSQDRFFMSPGSGGGLVVLAKGAPLPILTQCSHLLSDTPGEGPVPLTEEMKREIMTQVDTLSATGLRVLGMCYRRIPELPARIQRDEENVLTSEEKLKICVQDMVFCGLVGMMDPPRRGVKQAVLRARRGGVRTVMITGDYLKTAIAIAEMVSILEPSMDEAESAVDCSKLRPHGTYLTHHEIDAITWHTFVFARAKPEDKLEIVKSFQRQGFVCGMTGDGVNDAPALRQANIGIAMGLAGSEVAKAASDMILTDDKFSSIVDAVELGRTIYANLRKFVMYLIGTNWSQVLVILVSVLIGMPSPLEPLQILYINLVTDSAPAIALSIEKAELDVMKERPRKPDEEILSGVIVKGIIGHASSLVLFMLLSFFMGLWWETGEVLLEHMYDDDDKLVRVCERLGDDGVWDTVHDKNCIKDGLAVARTMVFLTIVFSESLRPLTARSFSTKIFEDLFSNRYLLYAIAFSISCTLFIVFVPKVNDIFHVKSPRWFEWLFIVFGVLMTIFFDERLKNILREEGKHQGRWSRLFTQINDTSREIRNMRIHLESIQESKV